MLTKCVVKEKKTGKFQYHIQPATFWIATALIIGFVGISVPLRSVFSEFF